MATQKNANSGDQGTGKHPHKSSEEPFPHHEAETTQHGGSGESESKTQHTTAGASHAGSHSSKTASSESDDLKEREYRDSEGNVHHHTKAYEEQHKSKK